MSTEIMRVHMQAKSVLDIVWNDTDAAILLKFYLHFTHTQKVWVRLSLYKHGAN